MTVDITHLKKRQLEWKSAYEEMQDIKEYNISYILRVIDTDGNIKMHYETESMIRSLKKKVFSGTIKRLMEMGGWRYRTGYS